MVSSYSGFRFVISHRIPAPLTYDNSRLARKTLSAAASLTCPRLSSGRAIVPPSAAHPRIAPKWREADDLRSAPVPGRSNVESAAALGFPEVVKYRASLRPRTAALRRGRRADARH